MTDPAAKLPIRLCSTVIKGFGRGSRELGIPTANLSREEIGEHTFDNLQTGIYWGFAGLKGGRVYKSAISIGYNPTYGNTEKTIEPHLIDTPESSFRTKSICGETQMEDFYGQRIKLSIVGFMRNELPYEGVDKLIEAIKNDIVVTERECDEKSEVIIEEKRWCAEEEVVK